MYNVIDIKHKRICLCWADLKENDWKDKVRMKSINTHHRWKSQGPINWCLTDIPAWLMQRIALTFWRVSCVLLWILIFSPFWSQTLRADIHFVKQQSLIDFQANDGELCSLVAQSNPTQTAVVWGCGSMKTIGTHFWKVVSQYILQASTVRVALATTF